MLDRSETILDTSHSDDSRAPLSKDETAAYIQESENDSPTAAGERASFPSTSDAQEPPQEPPSDVAGRHRSRSQHSTGSGSVSGSDLDLTEMRHDDPMYASANGRSSQDKLKLDTSRRGWTDMFDTEEPDTSMDRDSKEARRLGKKQFLQKTGINAILIGLWYILSISMSVYNKWMFSEGNLDFHYPLFTTSVHMIVQWLLASAVLIIFPFLRPQHGGSVDHDPEEHPRSKTPPIDHSKPIMTWYFYLTRIASCATVTGLDIGLGNTSLIFITLTFFTMCKSSTLGFVLLFAIIFRLEVPSVKIFSIIAVMTIGVIMMVAGETEFNLLGFILLMLASFFSGLRWSLTQILLRRTPATSNPFSTLFFITPVMFLVLFLLAIPVEGFPGLKIGLDHLAEKKGLFMGICIVLFPGCIAFCMTSAEFALLKRTSVVTLSVCGIFKEVLTITVAGIVFGDELTPINISGLLITIVAIAVYNVTRMKKMRRKELNKAQERWDEAHSPMLDQEREGERANIATIMNGDSRHSREHSGGSSSAERLGSTVRNVPAALMKVKKRGEYDQLEQDDR